MFPPYEYIIIHNKLCVNKKIHNLLHNKEM